MKQCCLVGTAKNKCSNKNKNFKLCNIVKYFFYTEKVCLVGM